MCLKFARIKHGTTTLKGDTMKAHSEFSELSVFQEMTKAELIAEGAIKSGIRLSYPPNIQAQIQFNRPEIIEVKIN